VSSNLTAVRCSFFCFFCRCATHLSSIALQYDRHSWTIVSNEALNLEKVELYSFNYGVNRHKPSCFTVLGCGLIIKKGTWHDFPVSLGNSVTVLTFNSAEVVEALAAMREPGEMLGQGDVFKIDIQKRLGLSIAYEFEMTTHDGKNNSD
jgi:hypothetical protein